MRSLTSRRVTIAVASAAFLLVAATSLPTSIGLAWANDAQQQPESLEWSADSVSVQVASDAAQFAITTADLTVEEAPEPEPEPEPAQEVTVDETATADEPPAETEAPAETQAPVAAVTNGPSVGAVLGDINAQRAAAGLPPLSSHGGLASIAQGWSASQAASNASGHNPSFSSQTSAIGCGYGTENVAYTMGPTQTPMTFWMGSPPHRANILSAEATAVGVGAATSASGITYYTLNFGNC